MDSATLCCVENQIPACISVSGDKMAASRKDRKRKATCVQSYNESTDYTTDEEESPDTSCVYGKLSTHKGRENNQKAVAIGRYADNMDSGWAARLKSMMFEFTDLDYGDHESQCKSEIEEANITRYLDTINSHMDLVSMTVKHGTKLYFKALRTMAMKHLLNCLKQGEINQLFKKQNGDEDTDTSATTTDTETGPEEVTIKESAVDDKAECFSKSECSGMPEKKINEKDVKWIVSQNNRHYPGFSSPPIDPREASCLHPALACLKPRSPSEPFLLFGAGVKCCELKYIFSLEKYGGPFIDDVEVDSIATEFVSLLEELHTKWLEENESSDNFLQQLMQVVKAYMIDIKDNDKRLEKFLKSDHAYELLHTMFVWAADKEVMQESNLQAVVAGILSLDGNATDNHPYKLNCFKKKEQLGPIIRPDIKYIPKLKGREIPDIMKEFRSKQTSLPVICQLKLVDFSNVLMKNEIDDDSGEIKAVTIRPELLWEIFEQLLATVLSSRLIEDKPVIYQGGLLIVGCQVRTIVLAIRNDCYKKIRGYSDVKDTLTFLKELPEGDWCTLYLEKSEHSLWNVIRRAKITYYNFVEHI